MNTQMIQVTKDQFYNIIGPLEGSDTGATMHHHPEKVMRWRVRQWIGGNYEEVAYSETLLSRPYPHQKNYYVSQRIMVF